MRQIHEMVRPVSIESTPVLLCSYCYWAFFFSFSFPFFDKMMDELVVLFIIIFLLLFFNSRICGCREGVQEFSKALLFTIVMILNTIRG